MNYVGISIFIYIIFLFANIYYIYSCDYSLKNFQLNKYGKMSQNNLKNFVQLKKKLPLIYVKNQYPLLISKIAIKLNIFLIIFLMLGIAFTIVVKNFITFFIRNDIIFSVMLYIPVAVYVLVIDQIDRYYKKKRKQSFDSPYQKIEKKITNPIKLVKRLVETCVSTSLLKCLNDYDAF